MTRAPRIRKDEDWGGDEDPIIILTKEHSLTPSQMEAIIKEESN